MRWTCWHQLTNDGGADGEAVWSWHLDADAKFAGDESQATVTRKPITGESSEETVKTIVQGMPECLGLSCGDYACVLFSTARKAAGAAAHPAFPAPSLRGG